MKKGKVIRLTEGDLENLVKRIIKEEKEFTETAINALQDTVFVFDPSNGKPVRWNKVFNKVRHCQNSLFINQVSNIFNTLNHIRGRIPIFK